MGVRVYIVKNSNIKNFTLNKNEKIDCHIKKERFPNSEI